METTIKIPREELLELIEDAESEHAGNWRWGTIKRFIFEYGGGFYAVNIRIHTEDGWQTDELGSEVEVRRVEKREVTSMQWVPA